MPNNDDPNHKPTDIDRYERLQKAAETQIENVTKAYEKHSKLLIISVSVIAALLALVGTVAGIFFYSNIKDMRSDFRDTANQYITNADRRVDLSLEALTNKLESEVQDRFKSDNIDNLISQRIKNVSDKTIYAEIQGEIDPIRTDLKQRENRLGVTLAMTQSNLNYLNVSEKATMNNLTQGNDVALTVLRAGLDDQAAFDKLVFLRDTLTNDYAPFIVEAINYITTKSQLADQLNFPNLQINWAAFNLSETNVSFADFKKIFPTLFPTAQKLMLNFISQQKTISKEDKLQTYLILLLNTSSIEVKTCVCSLLDTEFHTNLNILGTPILLHLLTNEYQAVVISDCNAILATNTTNSEVYEKRAHFYLMVSSNASASSDFQQAIRLNTKDFDTFNSEAWLLSTSPDPSIRNGVEAFKYATNACSLTGWTNWYCVGTLAAACAENGAFDDAVKYQKQSLSLSGMADVEKTDAQFRLELYKRKEPYRIGMNQ